MEDWQRELYRQFEQWANEAEQFWTEATQAVLDTIEDVSQLADAIAKDFEDSLWEELQQLEDWLGSPPADAGFVYRHDRHVEHGTAYYDDLMDFRQWRAPAACMDCRHYHGQVYGGNLLVGLLRSVQLTDSRLDSLTVDIVLVADVIAGQLMYAARAGLPIDLKP